MSKNSKKRSKQKSSSFFGVEEIKEHITNTDGYEAEPLSADKKDSAADDLLEEIMIKEVMLEGALTEEREAEKESRIPGLIFTCINAFLLFVVTVSSVIIHNNTFTLDISLIGDGHTVIQYGEPYDEKGIDALFYGTLLVREPQRAEVKTTGEVDTSVIGEYTVTYEATYVLDYLVGKKVYTDTIDRAVSVVDTVPPVIDLVHDPEAYTIPGQAYKEEGFTATDEYDGDLTDKVVFEEKDGIVFYSVSDNSGNVFKAEREIYYHDPYPPEIILLGDAQITITEGTAYKEPGYLANDNVDGDITELVTVSGTVDTAVPGTYSVEYTVADSYNNSTAVVRTVTVKKYVPPVVMPQGSFTAPENPNGKVIYLTFDDGPGKHTARLLDILDKYGVKATFFVINTEYFHLLPRMVESGHTVAMHAYEHNYQKVYASEEAYFADLYAIQSKINEYTGQTPTILRFPGGSSNWVSRFNPGIMTRLSAQIKGMGYRYFDWNVDSCDAGGTKTSWGVYNNVISYVPKYTYSVVLQHDIFGYSVDAVESIIIWGLENGYTFCPLTNQSPVCEHNIKN